MPFIFPTGGSGSVTTITSGTNVPTSTGFLSTASLTLAAATLSGGIRIASATGSIPQALTTKIETFITGTTMTRSGICFDVDGNHVWVTDRTLNQVKRILLSTGVIDKVVTGSTTDPVRNAVTAPESLNLGFGNRMWFASTTTHMVGFVDMTTGTPICEMFSGSGLPSNPYHVCEHLAGRILVRAGTGTAASTYSEFAYSGTGSANTVAYTGAQIIEGTTFYEAVADLSGNFFLTNGTNVTKRVSSTLTASLTLTAIGGFAVIPGYPAACRQLFYHPSNAKLHVRHNNNEDEWMQVDGATMTIDQRSYPNAIEWGGPVGSNLTSMARSCAAFSPDGTIQAHFTVQSEANALAINNIRTMTLGIQRARWAWTPASASHVYAVSFAGAFANNIGSIENMPSNKWLNHEYDQRKTKFFYSTDGGTTRTEFKQAEFISVVVSGTLTVDADMQVTPLNVAGPRPYIGDSVVSGRAGFILFDPNG